MSDPQCSDCGATLKAGFMACGAWEYRTQWLCDVCGHEHVSVRPGSNPSLPRGRLAELGTIFDGPRLPTEPPLAEDDDAPTEQIPETPEELLREIDERRRES